MRIQKKRIRKLKLRMLIFAVTAIVMPFSAQAQDVKIALPNKTLTAQKVFEEINRQTSYKVMANMSRLGGNLSVKINRSPIAVSEVLNLLLNKSGYTYSMDGNVIIVPVAQAKDAAKASSVTVEAVRTLVGTVKNSTDDQFIEGVTVEILGIPGAKTQTNILGRFSIEKVPSGNHVVKLTTADSPAIRYREITVPATGNTDVTLVMSKEVLSSSKSTAQQPSVDLGKVKTTSYYIPNVDDYTVRASSDEPKADIFIGSASQLKATNYLPGVAVKTNLLYLATTSLNVAAEFGLSRRWTLDVVGGINTWDLNGNKGGIRHWLVQPEVRYWFCNRFEKHFIGLHAIGGQYQIQNIDLSPFGNDLTDKRYDGWGVGGGVSYGYHLPMGKRWAWEFTVGAGYIYLDYDKYNCGKCASLIGRDKKHYFGPTKAGVSLIFMIK